MDKGEESETRRDRRYSRQCQQPADVLSDPAIKQSVQAVLSGNFLSEGVESFPKNLDVCIGIHVFRDRYVWSLVIPGGLLLVNNCRAPTASTVCPNLNVMFLIVDDVLNEISSDQTVVDNWSVCLAESFES